MFEETTLFLISENSKRMKLPATELIQLLTCEHLTELENKFKCGQYEEGMSKGEFFSAIKSSITEDVLGPERDTIDCDQLYLAFFDRYQIEQRLTWNSVLGALINAIPSEDESKVKLKLLGIHENQLTKRDSIVKILTIETTAHFCFTVYSKYGRTGIYDADFKELAVYHVVMTREDISRRDGEKRRRNRWITDAIYLNGSKKIFVINTARSLVIYDVVGLNHRALFLILSLPNIPKCIAYKFDGTGCNRHIFIGDDNGSILMFSFVHSKENFLRKKHNDKLSLYYWESVSDEAVVEIISPRKIFPSAYNKTSRWSRVPFDHGLNKLEEELQTEKEYLKLHTIKKIHKEIIREIIYCKEDNTLTTCSRDPNSSVVKLFLDHRKPTMIYEMPKGTSTMNFSKKLNLLITGSPDGTIRIWNTLVITEAIAVIKEHHTGIKGIILLETLKVFVSCSKDGLLKLWSIDNQKSYQTIHLDFRSLKEDGKIVEWAAKCIFLGPKSQEQKEIYNSTSSSLCGTSRSKNGCERAGEKWERSLIWVCCCNYLASISLEFYDPNVQKAFEISKLDPPPKQNNVFVPSTWLLNEESLNELVNKVQSDIEHPEKFKDYKYISRKGRLDKEERRNNTNQKIAQIDKQKRKMQENVAKGAPFLALELFDIEELALSDRLAIHDKEEKTLMDKTRNLLLEARNKDQVFSELSSSRSRSSRSSVAEFEY